MTHAVYEVTHFNKDTLYSTNLNIQVLTCTVPNITRTKFNVSNDLYDYSELG